ncbi:CRISPR-associated endonuclease Cas3'' [Stappia sp. GBMRC 2046]|uniref:CRISPR-associated endonuclease Cas3 n=1 Tax=Stappia sediminis TaxID=2692190 RepID=A0A7X3LXY1_9HYPH|nr:CRISPR-associated endonuclease Cas3'' [Stappia sediminis]MXN67132.1 CRISPR-associated endonuclease Cas3'' [Stappia sediminis]
MFFAHSTGDPSKSDWQGLSDHLTGVAELAASFGRSLGLEKPARLAGLLHDLGKYTNGFQARLEGAGARIDHSTAGAILARQLGESAGDRAVAELVSYAVAGHHGGLPDMRGEAGTLAERLKKDMLESLDPAWAREIEPDGMSLMPALKLAGTREKAAFQFSFLGRMIFSCLVDADFLDTERFYASIEGQEPDRDWPELPDIVDGLIARFDGYMAGLREQGEKTPLNGLRTEILDHARHRAGEPPGLFTLNVPTGGGKTLASLGFALDHAKRHGLRRIIYAIPFTSIVDQTARIFQQVLGPDMVLVHHSTIEEDGTLKERCREGRGKLRLAMEDWAPPVVVTTNVQFFESLFAAKPSRCRKLHNIAGSVIVLDEAQVLPRALLAPTVRAIEELARNYGCSVVLCTATQPAFDARNFPEGHPLALPLEGRELAPDPQRLAKELKRATIRHTGEMADTALIDALGARAQGLVIVNSRKHAYELFTAAGSAGLDGLIHLTTRQFAAHRREILSRIRERLKEGRTCRVIATSLVEAGVDVDFPNVWRAEAGLDQIVQAAGRCNREGINRAEDSIVTVFACPDYPPPAEIRQLAGDLSHVRREHDDLSSPEAVEAFFRQVYWRLDDGLDKHRILKRFRMDRTGTDFAYRTVAENYRMIESGLAPVIVARDEAARNILEALKSGRMSAGAAARGLQPWTVQVPPAARKKLRAKEHIGYVRADLYGDQFAVLRGEKLYRQEAGLIWEDADYLALEGPVI